MRQTDTQKNFKKEMEKLKDSEVFSRNPRKRTVTFHEEENGNRRKRPSLVRIMMVLWTTFALMTWILPVFGINPYRIFNNTTTNHPKNEMVMVNTEMVSREVSSGNYNEIVAYLDKTTRMEQEISEMMNQLSHIIQSVQLDTAEIQFLYRQVDHLKNETYSSNAIFNEFNRRNQDLLNTVERIILVIIESEGHFDQRASSRINQYYRELDMLMHQRLSIMIRLFQENNINYTLNEDGSMSYFIQ